MNETNTYVFQFFLFKSNSKTYFFVKLVSLGLNNFFLNYCFNDIYSTNWLYLYIDLKETTVSHPMFSFKTSHIFREIHQEKKLHCWHKDKRALNSESWLGSTNIQCFLGITVQVFAYILGKTKENFLLTNKRCTGPIAQYNKCVRKYHVC